jgi:hypothetical protein
MKAIRFIILIAIFVLVGLAFISRSPDQEEGIESIDALMKPLLEMQSNIENGYPKLRGDMEKLITDITKRFSGIDPKNIIPFALPVSGSSTTQGIQPLNTLAPDNTEPQEQVTDSPSEESTGISDQMKNLAANLKDMDAEELAQRMELIRQQLKLFDQQSQSSQDGTANQEASTEDAVKEDTTKEDTEAPIDQ